MNNGETSAKIFIALGLAILIFGLIMYVASKMGLSAFHLPGDIVIKRKNFTLYFPWVTGLVLSLLLTLIFYILGRK